MTAVKERNPKATQVKAGNSCSPADTDSMKVKKVLKGAALDARVDETMKAYSVETGGVASVIPSKLARNSRFQRVLKSYKREISAKSCK